MAAFDRLPPALRHWLHTAALPWSPASARRVWERAMREAKGCEAAALARLDRVEAERLGREGGFHATNFPPRHTSSELSGKSTHQERG